MKQLGKFGLSLITLLLVLSACTVSTAIPGTTPVSSPTALITATITAVRITATSASLPIERTPTEWLPYNSNYSSEGCGEFTATLPVKGTENLSQIKISQKLFETYLAHYKSPNLGGLCRLEDFKVEKVEDRFGFLAAEQKVDFVNAVEFSVQVKEAPTGWAAGNGELASDGWILHKFLIVGVSKIDNQYALKLIGTGP